MTDEPRGKIVVTGAAGRLGRQVVKLLHRTGQCELVVLDRREMRDLPKDIRHLQVDLRSKRALDAFRHGDVTALVHLGLMHNPRSSEHHAWNVLGTSQLLDCCLEHGVGKVVVLSSADVYGPRRDNHQFLTEDAPLMGAQAFPDLRDLVEVDMQATSFFWRSRRSELETVVLRPVHILGTVRNAPSNYLRLGRIPLLLGFDPMVQVIAQADVADAIVTALRPGVHGIFNLTGPSEVPLSVIVGETGRPTLPVPYALFRPAMKAMWELRMTSFPVPQLDHLRFVAMVDGGRAREELGFVPRLNLRETVQGVYERE